MSFETVKVLENLYLNKAVFYRFFYGILLLLLLEVWFVIKNIFINLKKEYKEYIILIKSGNFYLALGNDAKIIENMFNYKVKEFSGTIRVGFPIISLNKVTDRLDRIKVNYVIFDKEIVLKRKFNNNRYNEFIINNLSINDRINNINFKLNELKSTSSIIDVLNKVENCLWKTD